MISNSSKVLFYVLISAGLLLTLDADDEDCTIEIQVRRNTIYEAFVGDKLKVDCPVVFCNNPPPTIYWYKIEEKHVRINVTSNSHITIGLEMSNPLKGTSYLLFQNVVSSDSGVYRCENGGTISHEINITVIGATDVANTSNNRNNIKKMTNDTKGTVPQDIFWHYMYRVFGIGAFFVTVISICIISQTVFKGRCRKTADPCPQSSDQI